MPGWPTAGMVEQMVDRLLGGRGVDYRGSLVAGGLGGRLTGWLVGYTQVFEVVCNRLTVHLIS